MNNSVKFKDFSLHLTDSAVLKASEEASSLKFKDNCCNWLRRGRGVRLMLLAAAMMLGGMTAQGQQAYVFYRSNGYIYKNGNNGSVTTTFTKSCIWIAATGTLNTTGQAIYSYTANTSYMRGGNGSFTLGNSQSNWQLRDNVLAYRSGGRSYHVYWTGSALSCAQNQSGNGFTPYAITINNSTPANPTISITAASALSNGGIQLTGSITGTYTPSYSYATVRNYNNGNTQTYYWTSTTEATTTQPASISSWGDATKTWTVTTGGAYASVNSDGLVTITNPIAGDIVVTLTYSKGGYTGTQTFTLTRTHFDETSPTTATITGLTVSPSTATLEYDESQAFTASATVNATTTTTAAYERLTNGGNNYYYYDGALHAATPTPVEEVTHPTPTYSWALSGTAATYLSLSTASGATTTATHSTGAQSNSNATLTVTATTPGASNSTATATITVVPTTATAIAGDNQTIYVGNGGTVTYTLTPAHAYDRVSATSGNTGVFTVDASPVGSVAITPVAPGQTTLTLVALKPDGTNGSSTTVTITVRNLVATPEISFALDGSDVKATLTCATGGATIKYTTDGSDPATSGTAQTYSGTPFTVTNGTTVKAYATSSNEYLDASATVTKVCTPLDYVEQGVSGNIVTLNDLEDHNWSYYQASGNLPTEYPTTYLSSPDPRNVKITYRGGGVEGGSAVAISALDGENQNEMIYYKTLEKAVPGMTGDYPYTVISNPFSKRPKEGSDYYGFAGWQVISGGEYISEYDDDDVLPLDATIHFVDLPAGNGGNGAVVFEATWTVATVIAQNSAPTFSGGTYETNFWVLTGDPNAAVTVPANSTMTARYPDGTVSWSGNFTRAITAGGNNAKVEFVNMNSTGNVSASNYTFTMGRGIVNSGNGGDLQGCTRDANCNQTVKIESGTYATLHNFTINTLTSSRTCDQLMILGCDYDRARGDNTKMIIRGDMYVAESKQLNRATGSLYVRVYIKSGNFGSDVTVSGNNNYTGAGGTQTYYMSVSGAYNRGRRFLCMEGGRIDGIAGGMDSVTTQDAQTPAFDLRVRGTAQIDGVVYGAAEFAAGKGIRTMIFTGGTVNGWIAGGANGTRNDGGRLNGLSYIYFGGKARLDSDESEQRLNSASGGNLFGAGCGFSATAYSGQVYLGTNVVVADDAYIERAVYGGGGFGYCHSSYTSNIFILGGTVDGVSGGITNDGYTNSGSNSRQTNPRYLSTIAGGVFGGACQNKGGTVNIIMTGGLVKGGIYGGSNYKGTVTGPVTLHIDGGQVGVDADHPANIHGGGYGENTSVSGNVAVNLGVCNAASGVTVYGDVYGGSALGTVNTNGSNTTTVSLYKGIIYGGLYGGALGDASHAAVVNGAVTVNVYGGSVLCSTNDPTGEAGTGSVFGCNNVKGAPASTVAVHIYNTDQPLSGYALHAVYGGGNNADYTANIPDVTIHGCDNSIEYVYGGGNAAAVKGTNVVIWGGRIGNAFGGGNGFSVSGNHTQPAQPHYNPGANITTNGTHITIHGGEIGAVFGGSNQYGTITGDIIVDASAVAETGSDPCSGKSYSLCDMEIGELYGGGNEAEITVTPTVNLDCSVNVIKLFGGAKKANFSGNINLVVDGGHYHQVFGGNNISGTITGDVTVTFNGGYADEVYGGNNEGGTITGKITVNIDSTNVTCTERFHVGDVYGGGNMASYSAPAAPNNNYPEVNIKNGTIRNNVFGGGYGSAAVVTGNPIVTVGVSSASKTALVLGNVFGGGNAAAITGNTTVHVYYNSVVKGNVFGGGNNAAVSFNTEVFLNHQARVYGNIYGGGNKGEIGGNTRVIINSSK